MTETEIPLLEGVSEIDIAWLAGLLEGEGSFEPLWGYRNSVPASRRSISDKIQSI